MRRLKISFSDKKTRSGQSKTYSDNFFRKKFKPILSTTASNPGEKCTVQMLRAVLTNRRAKMTC